MGAGYVTVSSLLRAPALASTSASVVPTTLGEGSRSSWSNGVPCGPPKEGIDRSSRRTQSWKASSARSTVPMSVRPNQLTTALAKVSRPVPLVSAASWAGFTSRQAA